MDSGPVGYGHCGAVGQVFWLSEKDGSLDTFGGIFILLPQWLIFSIRIESHGIDINLWEICKQSIDLCLEIVGWCDDVQKYLLMHML